MKLIIARHTSTDWNLIGRIQGRTDNSLNEQGRSEARKLGGALLSLRLERIISSDLKRAVETAEIIHSIVRMSEVYPFGSVMSLALDSRLRECSFGEIEGLTRQEATDKYGEAAGLDLSRLPNYPYDFRPYGGECRQQVFDRYMEVVNYVKKSNKKTLLVGHGRGMRTLLEGLGYRGDVVNFKRGDYRLIEVF